MPWLNCSEFNCAARHSMPPLAGHSMKWIRDTDGKRTMSFMARTQWPLDQAVDHQPVLIRIDVRPPGVIALEKQAVRRDDAVQILQRRETDRRFGAGGEPRHVAPGSRRPRCRRAGHRAGRLPRRRSIATMARPRAGRPVRVRRGPLCCRAPGCRSGQHPGPAGSAGRAACARPCSTVEICCARDQAARFIPPAAAWPHHLLLFRGFIGIH